MSDYQPKVGDRVMVGEHGPYEAKEQVYGRYVILDIGAGEYVGEAHPDWLTPAPEPEPDEPTTYGALVRDGHGRLWIHNPIEHVPNTPAWDTRDRLSARWADLPRPITVVLADPAEVDALREDRDQWESDYQEAMRECDELQRRIDEALALVDNPHFWANHRSIDRQPKVCAILRGES